MRTRVKICGITRRQDALDAVILGADAIGMVFYPPSPRAVDVGRARELVAGLPPFVTVVGLFVNPLAEEVRIVLDGVRIDLLQFHGDEAPELCAAFGKPYLKGLRMREGIDLHREKARYTGAAALLLDAYRPGVPGGTGAVFDWSRIPRDLAGHIVLAGGLDADNVERAVREVRPYAVDVSGGVEHDKGVKDPARIAAFLRGVKRGNDD